MAASMSVDSSDQRLSRKTAIITIVWVGIFTALAFGLILFGESLLLGLFG